MRADYLTYKRAIEVSVMGLVVQLTLGLVLTISAILGQDMGAFSGGLLILVGVIGWLMLAIVYDQHRRERIEAMEAESLASADSASVFEEGATDLKVAAKRVRTMHRLVLPVVSVLIAGAFIGLGVWRYQAANAIERGEAVSRLAPTWSLAISVTVAFFGFVLARYVAGMAKQRAWVHLRAGASAAAGMAVVGLLLAIGYLVELAAGDVLLRVLRFILPAAMVVLGIEVIVSLLLELYRPRRAGELPRPAFDSRLLGWVAAPDKVAESIGEAINYQFGSDVSSSWQYRLIARSSGWLVVLAVGVMWGLTSLAVVQPHQRGMVLRFGEIVREDIGPGLHFKLPWPIDSVAIPEQPREDERGRALPSAYTVTGVRQIHAGAQSPQKKDAPVLWGDRHAGANEQLFIVQSGGSGRSTGDVALVAAEIPIQYNVRDVEAYEKLAPPAMRDDLLQAVAERAAMRYLSGRSIEDVLSRDRPATAAELRRQVQKAFDDLSRSLDLEESPVEVLMIGMEGVHPPTAAADSFSQVVEAQQKYLARRYNAEATATAELTSVAGSPELAERLSDQIDELNRMKLSSEGVPQGEIEAQEARVQELLDEAGGEVASIMAQARSDRWKKHMREYGKAQRQEGRLASYNAAPKVYKATLIAETLKEGLRGKRLYIVSDVPYTDIRVDLGEDGSLDDVFQEALRTEQE